MGHIFGVEAQEKWNSGYCGYITNLKSDTNKNFIKITIWHAVTEKGEAENTVL